ncbi:MAG: DNA repair protein RecN [Gammaproteobacteria bacterium]|nr:DNA repair protein RecN [Gammaproteobacteria bacterium]MCY4219134.1 DNA repair protein RecN [Gammaproteobacteria bacterium]
MIDWLKIRQFAIVENLDIEFEANFTALTGETGSGKSVIIDAINVLLGDRSEATQIRYGQESAEIQAGFSLSENHPALEWLFAQGMDDCTDCILRRVLRKGRSSRGFINNHAATASQLRQLGELLVDIHGQHEHLSLLKSEIQRDMLDQAAGNKKLMLKISSSYQEIRDLRLRIQEIQKRSETDAKQIEILQFHLDEIKKLNPKQGEWDELESKQRRGAHQVELISAASSIYENLYSSETDSLNSHLSKHISRLNPLIEVAPELTEIRKLLLEAQINIEEASKQLEPLIYDNELDAESLKSIDDRLSEYHSLARKHKIHPEMLADHMNNIQAELETLFDPQTEIEELTAQLNKVIQHYFCFCKTVKANRNKLLKGLQKDISTIINGLGMQGGCFEIHLIPESGDGITRYGNESVEFRASGNPGIPTQPLNKTISGGELSRISLAIQVVLSRESSAPTMIFDEVDTGIGGEVANTIGQKLRELGERGQVICITHLTQVAIHGNHQFVVIKNTRDGVETMIRKLTENERIAEIARMISGEKVTSQTLEHARQLLSSVGSL